MASRSAPPAARPTPAAAVRHRAFQAAEAPRLAAARVRDGVASLRDRIGDRLTARRERPRGAGAATATGEPLRAGGTDWARLGAFGAGIAVGALLGAGTALLLAPATGFETRIRLARGARRVGDRVVDRWDDLGDAVRRGTRRTTSRVSRSLVRSRWAAEDAWERRLAEARVRARTKV
jgi:hypothetical protein